MWDSLTNDHDQVTMSSHFLTKHYTCGKTLNTLQHVQGAQSVSYIPHSNRYIKVNEYVLNTHIQMHVYIFAHQNTNLNTKYVYVAHISRHTPK
jgi:hypothetical protein